MVMPRVNVILSTYNGEKYIEEQLASLLAQDYPNINIYIRDDGSTDSTIMILEKYVRQGKIHLLQGENLGFCGSFFELLKETKDGDYWSFCDQDDIWEKDKIQRAVVCMEKQNAERPLLYYSLSMMVDEEGKELGVQEPPKGSMCFRRALTGTFGVGFSMVINRTLREYMLRCDYKRVHSHDWLAGAIALGMGDVILDRKICAKYRRLESSVTKITFEKKIKWFLNMLTEQGDVKERNMEYSRCFFNQLSEENRNWLNLFNKEKYSLWASLKKACYLHRWRPSLGSEAAMRILMIMGRV